MARNTRSTSTKPVDPVIPAQAGIQDINDFLILIIWTPAFAGVTKYFSTDC
jgi:hypothetical protein